MARVERSGTDHALEDRVLFLVVIHCQRICVYFRDHRTIHNRDTLIILLPPLMAKTLFSQGFRYLNQYDLEPLSVKALIGLVQAQSPHLGGLMSISSHLRAINYVLSGHLS